MVKIGNRITELRKNKGWSQTELAKQIKASREAIGKYERDEALPSVETAKKIADAFEVTLDYLVDEEALPTFDKKTVTRLKGIQQLDEENKSHVFAMLDAFLLKCSIQNKLSATK
jgi:transcriptional regulator with XRE-family HTH domain